MEVQSVDFSTYTKSDKYKWVHEQLPPLLAPESDSVANLGNAMALLKDTFCWWWVGIYRVSQNELVLGPFQGPVACTRIALGRGVCGSAWQQQKTIVVPNVHDFPGHIACSAFSQSEIVVPIFKGEEVVAVLDVDSEHLAHFDEIDARELGIFCASLVPYL
ncbi:MAG: GAF domain-containing protein [Bacteroidia bacterium]